MKPFKLLIVSAVFISILQCKKSNDVVINNQKQSLDSLVQKNLWKDFNLGKLIPSFKYPIPQNEEANYVQQYSALKNDITTLKSDFDINFKEFDTLIVSNIDNYIYCKFYLLETDSLNIGMSFSNNSGIVINSNDKTYILQNNKFITNDIKDEHERMNNINGINYKIKQKIINQKPTQVIQYDLMDVHSYNTLIKMVLSPDFLRFKMFLYDNNITNKKKKNRVAFAVHPHFQVLTDYKTVGYDAGTLWP